MTTTPEVITCHITNQPSPPDQLLLANRGVGLLSFPFAFTKTGLVPGVLLVPFVGGLEVATAWILCYYAGRHRAKTYQARDKIFLWKELLHILV